jgi:ATP-dependent exoDNAse (exonuclease V) beta subunit
MVLRAKQIRRELHFNRFLPYTDLTARKEYAEQLQDASLYVQGSLDLLLQNEDGSLILCDYKTDRLRDDDLIGEIHAPKVKAAVRSRLATDHADQLRIYADAVRSLFGKAPDKVLIYSLPLGCTVDLTDIVIKKE